MQLKLPFTTIMSPPRLRRLLVAAILVTMMELLQNVFLHQQLVDGLVLQEQQSSAKVSSLSSWKVPKTTTTTTTTTTAATAAASTTNMDEAPPRRNLSMQNDDPNENGEKVEPEEEEDATSIPNNNSTQSVSSSVSSSIPILSKDHLISIYNDHNNLQQYLQQQYQEQTVDIANVNNACSVPPGHGIEGRMGLQALMKLQIANQPPQNQQEDKRHSRILCLVMTDSTKHDTIVSAIIDTYAPYCDGFLAASNQTDPQWNAIDLFSTNMNNKNNDEWQRLLQLWTFVHEHYNNNNNNNNTTSFDAFFLGQEDTFVIPENLRALLAEHNNNNADADDKPLYLGGAVVPSRKTPHIRYCGAGAGYVLNRKALQLLIQEGPKHSQCHPRVQAKQRAQQQKQKQKQAKDSDVDVVSTDYQLAKCLVQIRPQSQDLMCQKTTTQTTTMTTDGGGDQSSSSSSSSALRFLEFGIDYQAKWNKGISGPIKAKALAQNHGIYMHPGISGISSHAIGFHVLANGTQSLLLQPQEEDDENNNNNMIISNAIRRIHAITRGYCNTEQYWKQPVTALDEVGNPGYVADPTILKQHPLAFSYHPLLESTTDTVTTTDANSPGICDVPFGQGIEGFMGYQGLQKIKAGTEQRRQKRKLQQQDDENENNHKKVLCLVYTHSERHDRIRAIAETYGSQCDGFIAASNVTDPTIGAVHIRHDGPEEYGNMWQKVRAIWEYVYEHYRNDYDLFHIGGDDHYAIPENIKYMVQTMEISTSTLSNNNNIDNTNNEEQILFLGGSMIDYPRTKLRYCGGGSGYTLNRNALTTFIEDLLYHQPEHCHPYMETSQEDKMISNCFRAIGISCMDTNDDQQESRYHQDDVNYHASWTKDQPSVWRAKDLEESPFHKIVSKEKMGQISDSSVSFHLKRSTITTNNKDNIASSSSSTLVLVKENVNFDGGIRRYHAILNGLCD